MNLNRDEKVKKREKEDKKEKNLNKKNMEALWFVS